MRKLHFLALIWLLLMPSTVWADEVFVGNKPFEGRVYGLGKDIRFSLVDLGQALGLAVDQTAEGWFLDGARVVTRQEQGVVWVSLGDLPSESVRVVENRALGTIDVYRAEKRQTADRGQWGGDGTMVVFGANWCPVTAKMRQTISEIERSQTVQVVYVDVEDLASPSNRQFAYLFEGDKIPFFVLLDSKGRKLRSFMGIQTYSEMLDILEQSFK